jgi:lysozyme
MNNSRLKQALTLFEGYRTSVYKDSVGLLTVGVGHLVLTRENLSEGDKVSDQQIQQWFDADIQRSTLLAQQIVPGFKDLDEVRQEVCVTLTFNLASKLMGFGHFLAAMKAKDWPTAAAELRNSKWATQVGSRCNKTCDALTNGFWNL